MGERKRVTKKAGLIGVDVFGTGTLELFESVWMHVVFTMRAGAGI